jgi:signal peptidase I
MNFPLILFLATVATGAMALLDRLFFARGRASDAREPWWIEYPKSFFPVLLIVFLLRSFVAEPFKIPSSSMRPTLDVGDFILVNKFAYGLRLPILEQKIVPVSDPQRGDVVVFRYPLNPSQDFIKRVIGLPGDTVVYKNKQLTVNGAAVAAAIRGHVQLPRGSAVRDDGAIHRGRRGDGANKEHSVAVDPMLPAVSPGQVRPVRRTGQLRLQFRRQRLQLQVPAGQYFVMGDNRDRSDDSRYWGFVPDDHLRGRAFFIWFNWDDISSFAFKRVGRGIR